MTQENNRGVFSFASVQDPTHWNNAWNELRSKAVRSRDQIVLTHDAASPLNSNSFKARLSCSVRILPRLHEVKSALRRMVLLREMCADSVLSEFPSADVLHHDGARDFKAPNPTIWAAESSVAGGVTVTDALSGALLMRISHLKSVVLVSSLMHAPFRGLIDRHQKIVPIKTPKDLLSVREATLIVTDYVWVGFADGSIRLFPADPQRVRDQDRSVLLARGDIADLVYELPKNHNAAIVAINRSPCHEDDKTTDLVTKNRLSSAVRELTAATSSELNNAREHLSLVCTASEDSCIVVWDLRKIYRRLEEMRMHAHDANKNTFGMESNSRVNVGDVVTFELTFPRVTLCSSCTMVKVRPLFKLKGSVGGLRTLTWVTTNVTTAHYEKPRDVVAMTRDPKSTDASAAVHNRRFFQHSTQWERREEHRTMLRLSEEEMREVETELEELMPPIAPEPHQSRRINLIVAGDANGVVHLWDLDEELRRKVDMADVNLVSLENSLSRVSMPRASPSRSLNRVEASQERSLPSPCRSPCENKNSYVTQKEIYVMSPIVQPYDHGSGTLRFPNEKKDNLFRREEPEGNCLQASYAVHSPKLMQSSVTSQKLSKRARPSKKGLSTTSSIQTPSKKVSSTKQHVFSTTGCADASPRAAPRLSSSSRITTALTAGASSPVSRVNLSSRQFAHPLPCEKLGSGRKRFGAISSATSETVSLDAPGSPNRTVQRRKSKREKEKYDTHSASYRPSHHTPQAASPYVQQRSSRRTLPNASQQTPQKVVSRGSQKDLQVASPNGLRRSTRKGTSHATKQSAHKPPQQPLQVGGNPAASPVNKETWTVKWGSSRDVCALPSPARSLSARASNNGSSSVRTAADWLAGHAHVNHLYCRDAKCRMELTDGGAVSGLAVDIPPVIVVTMRRLPDPEERMYSLLEQMPDEEVCRRQLANTFFDLTDDRALHCALKRLQFYLSVEGTVMNIQCVPKPTNPEGGAGPLRFFSTDRGNAGHKLATEDSAPLAFRPLSSPSSFRVVFRRHVLERHSQPISMIFVDHPRRHLWVARHDGLFSIFSTVTGAILTRLPHPSASSALGPPSAIEWRRQQRNMALNEGRSVHLEIHRECRDFSAAYFINAVPVAVMQEFALLRLAVSGVLEPGTENDVEIVKMDGRTNFDGCGRGREVSLARFLQSLKQHRKNAVAVVEAQRDSYHFLCSLLAYRVRLLIGHCASLTVLHAARRAFRSWREHCKYFSREFVLRRMRKTRLKKLAHAATFSSTLFSTKLIRLYCDRWRTYVRMLRVRRYEVRLARCFGFHKRPEIHDRITNFLGDYSRRRRYWLLWRSIVVLKPFKVLTLSTPRGISPRAGSGTLTPRHANRSGIFGNYSPRSARMSFRSSLRSPGEDRNNVFADFNSIICSIHAYRERLIQFRFDENADSVLDIDDLWADAIQTAVSEADSETAYSRKLAVFKFSLLPLLDGVLSTAEEVLPQGRTSDVSDDVHSLIRACLQSIDYLHADPEFFEVSLRSTEPVKSESVRDVSLQKEEGACLPQDSEMRALFDETMDETSFRMQIESITSQRYVIREFLRVCCTS